MTPRQPTIPTWLAVLGLAVLLAAWTVVFAGLMGDHVAATSGGRALAAATTHATVVG